MPKIKIICDTCGNSFERYPSQIKEKNFCCRECYLKDHSKEVKYYTCEVCGKTFKGNKYNANKYCSRECYNKIHNIDNKIRVCPICGQEFVADRQTRIYCSMDCYNKDRHPPKGEDHPN